MTNPVFLGAGHIYPGKGIVTGHNREGDRISGHKTAPGQWELTNQANGTQFGVQVNKVGPNKHFASIDVTKTDAEGNQTTNDLTLIRGRGTGFGVFDLDRSGFEAIA